MKEAGFSGWCAVFWGKFQRDRGEKRAKRCFNGGECYGNRGFIRLIPHLVARLERGLIEVTCFNSNFEHGIFHGIDTRHHQKTRVTHMPNPFVARIEQSEIRG